MGKYAVKNGKHKKVVRSGLALLLLLLSCLCLAQQEAIVVKRDSSVNLTPHLSYWVTDRPLSIEDVSSLEYNKKFQPLAEPVIEFKRWVWYRFSLRRAEANGNGIFLNFNENIYDELLVFYKSQGAWEQFSGGLIHPYRDRPIDARQLVFPVWVEEGETAYIYFRLKTSTFALFHPVLQSDTRYFAQALTDNNITMFVIGLLVGILVYMISITVIVQQKKKMVACAFFLFSTLLMVLYFNGYFFRYLNDLLNLQRNLYVFLLSLMTFLGGVFVWTILVSDRIFPSVARYLKGLLIAFLLLPVCAIFGYYEQVSEIQGVINIAFPTFIFLFSVYAMYKRVASSSSYFLAVLFYTGIQFLSVVTIYGDMEYNFLTRHYFEFAVLALGLFLSVAITTSAYRERVRQEELERVVRIAEAKDHAKSEFLAAMSHEIRTPINGIMGMAQMLQRTALDKTQQYYSDVIISAGKTLLNIINDVLDFSKIEAGKFELEEDVFNLGEMIAHVSLLFGSSRSNDQVDFELYSDARIPLWLKGDRARLQQIINNILSNAFKFTERGSVEFRVELEEWVNPGRVRLMFKVKDTGIGISSELRGRLFTPYTQVDKSTTKKFGGTGLGLSICKRLVAMMGGEIGVDSRSGQGSCFWFSIELDVLEEKQNELLKSRSELKKKVVALILAESASQQLIAEHLIEWGMVVDCIEPSVLPAALDYAAYDIIIVGSSVSPSFGAWLEQASAHESPTLLLNPINDTRFQGDAFQTEHIKYLKMPASLTQLQYSLLELLGLTADSDDSYQKDTVPVSVPGVSDLAILVAEDNMVNLKVIQALLKSLDVTAEFVLDGLAAVEHYCSSPEHYDVILMDCEMPNMDGFEASKQIRAFEEQLQIRRVTICALTAHAMDDITDRCFAAGMDEVLIKPVDLDVLTRKLQEYARSLADSELP